ncbi:MAG: TauD/TfdA family dioxygenase [Pseudomonadota bacterium]|nr:TauD/TfdA family dioxygenase [Pseudomonadota bacterium]
MTMEVIRLNAPHGAEIRGLDLSKPMPDETIGSVRSAWYDNPVLLFREQKLDDAQLMGLARNFGDLELPPSRLLKYSHGSGQKDEVPPEINVISNVLENGKPIGQLGAEEAKWHSDTGFVEKPPAGSFLHAKELPDEGGNTSFLNLYDAYDAIPDDLRDAVENRWSKHDPSYTSDGVLRKDFKAYADPSMGPGPSHPLVRTHPKTGRKALYLGRRFNSYILGLTVKDSENLLDRLWEHATQDRFKYEHVWSMGDVLIWDNRCVMHRRDAFDPSARRRMHRAQTAGERPI